METKTIEFVKKRNGRLVPFEPDKINKCAVRTCRDLEGVSASELVLDAQLQLYNKVPTTEIDKSLILCARDKIAKEPNYSYVAARLLLYSEYTEVFEQRFGDDTLEEDYRRAFRLSIKRLVKAGSLDERMATSFDFKLLEDALVVKRDHDFKYTGLQILVDRYFLRNEDNRLMETPQAFWMRVSMGLALNESDCTARAIEFYNILSTFLYTPSTPTLFNSGTTHMQLSSCYLNTFDDSIDGIFDGLWQEARKSKFAGGLGFDVTPFRSSGGKIDGTPGICKGLIPWLRLFNDLLLAVNQKGKRPGAGCAYLEPWHKDFGQFIKLRQQTGDERMRAHDLNIAMWGNDEFFRRIEANEDWYMFCPHECPTLHDAYGEEFVKEYNKCIDLAHKEKVSFDKIKAKDLWKQILGMLFETSHPWITFKDPCNIRYANKHAGVVHSSNLCTEIVESTKASTYDKETGDKIEIGETAVCNLGSLNLKNHLRPVYIEKIEPLTGEVYKAVARYELDIDKLSNSIRVARRILDNVIDLNFYPTKEAHNSNMAHRPVGLGVMGLHDMMHMLDIRIDSARAIKFNNDLFELISYHAIAAGIDLAQERGTYSSYKGSMWDQGILPRDTFTYNEQWIQDNFAPDAAKALSNTGDGFIQQHEWDQLKQRLSDHGIRNSLCMAVAPTATIGDINGVEQSIEPNPSVLFVKENLSGNFMIINEHFVRDMKNLDLWTPPIIQQVVGADGDVTNLDIPIAIKSKYAAVGDRNMELMILANAARQRWVDQAISFNMYYFGSSGKDLSDLYMLAWKAGLKTTYYLRGTGATKIEKSTVEQGKRLPDSGDTFAANLQALAPSHLSQIMQEGVCEGCQ